MPVELLKAIALVESNCNPLAINRNANGTKDVGLMQINSVHFASLKANDKIDESELYEPCTNLLVASRILYQQVQHYGWSWQAIGAYHMPDGKQIARQKWYAQRVWNRINSVRVYPAQCMSDDSRYRR